MKAIVKDIKRNLTFGYFELSSMSMEMLLEIIGEKYRVEHGVDGYGYPTDEGWDIIEEPYTLIFPENDIYVVSYPEWGYEGEILLSRSYDVQKWIDTELDGDEDIARVLLMSGRVNHKYLDDCNLEYLGRTLEGTGYSIEDENIFRSERGYYYNHWF